VRTFARVFLFVFLIVMVPVVALAATPEADGHAAGFDWMLWTARILNAALFFGVLIYFIVPVARKMLSGRQQQIAEELSQAEQALADVRTQRAAAEEDLKKLEKEAATIRARATEEAEAEKVRILEDSEHAATRMVEMAEAQIEGAMREARRDLRKYATTLSGEMAEEILRKEIKAKDKETLFEEGVKSLEMGA